MYGQSVQLRPLVYQHHIQYDRGRESSHPKIEHLLLLVNRKKAFVGLRQHARDNDAPMGPIISCHFGTRVAWSEDYSTLPGT